MEGLTRLQALDISRNSLRGPLPVAWASSNRLELFAAEQNQLTGTIPVSNFAGRYFGAFAPRC